MPGSGTSAPRAHGAGLARAQRHLVTVCNRFTLAALAFVGLAMLGSLLLVSDLPFGDAVMFATVAVAGLTMVVCWCVAPLLRRRRVQRAAMPRRSPDRTARTGA